MSHELICTWLGLPADAWPPDHYRLLGLPPGEGDVALIEQRVHQRLDCVRRYQMMHPEQATEAMNRLAQAFVCLTEPGAKRAYDVALLGERAVVIPPPPVRRAVNGVKPPDEAPAPRDPLVWLYTPGVTGPGPDPTPPPPPVRLAPPIRVAPPVRVPPPPPPPPVRVPPPPIPPVPEPMAVEEPAEPPPPPPEPEPEPPTDTIAEAARASPQARRGLATRRALYHRVAQTRELLRLWHRLGKHLADPEKRLGKPEATELHKLLRKLEDALDDFPLLGEAGQPGHLILSLTHLEKSRELQALSVQERETLQRDWQAGLNFLQAHRDYLRVELKTHRRRGWAESGVRALRSWLNDQPLTGTIVVVALLAVAVAVFRTLWW